MNTIYSSASNNQKSALKIIRISGRHSNIVPSIFSFKATKPKYASLRKLYDHKNKIIDNALVIFFPGPLTATGEDIIELHHHGSIVIEKKIFQMLRKNKHFRLAEPGEYTKRAFLNGILDLTQAEGLNDLINAETENQFKLSMSQFEGLLSEKINFWRNDIIFLLSKLEALIDFSDEELPLDLTKIFVAKVIALLGDMNSSIKSSSYGERLRNGFIITLIGRPNVGKSSLVNFLSHRKVAIVTQEPGTTRDVLEVLLDFEGYPIILNDTAGIRSTESEIENIGINRALEKARKSDLILILSDDDNFTFGELKVASNYFLIHTKSDLGTSSRTDVHEISVKENKGIDKLIKNIVQHLRSLNPKENALLTRERHIQAVKKASEALGRVSLTNLNTKPELAAEDLRIAATAIGSITNSIDVEEILDDIFNSFCIGK
ncbi:tRNA uridine-5-carboxymethylaminomethyl(34) synthesis GTPase MnmE [Alphaproteobacteria bacterium]|nr:tRNA uridine-5-carboxymethylaminomethyl(34) synthesis GTPase MnmE [Alphaproteobacteria bacterium]